MPIGALLGKEVTNWILSISIAAKVSSDCFEMLGQLAKIMTYLLDDCTDEHGRSALLTSYVFYHRLVVPSALPPPTSPSTPAAGSSFPHQWTWVFLKLVEGVAFPIITTSS